MRLEGPADRTDLPLFGRRYTTHEYAYCPRERACVRAQPAYLLPPAVLQIVRQLQGQCDTKNQLQNCNKKKESQKFSV